MSNNEQGFRGIPGLQDGFELVEFRHAFAGDFVFDSDGFVHRVSRDTDRVLPIVRKIEKPKRYRPFKNGEEYSPHFDRIVIYKGQDNYDSFYRPSCFSNERVWIGPCKAGKTWSDAFVDLRFKDDGSPFGVEVTE